MRPGALRRLSLSRISFSRGARFGAAAVSVAAGAAALAGTALTQTSRGVEGFWAATNAAALAAAIAERCPQFAIDAAGVVEARRGAAQKALAAGATADELRDVESFLAEVHAALSADFERYPELCAERAEAMAAGVFKNPHLSLR